MGLSMNPQTSLLKKEKRKTIEGTASEKMMTCINLKAQDHLLQKLHLHKFGLMDEH